MSRPIVMPGEGGHARVLEEIINLQSKKVLEFTSDDNLVMTKYGKPNKILLVNGVGSVRADERRKRIFEKFKNKGYSFLTLIHPSAVFAKNVEFGEGAQVMAGTVIQVGTKIGTNTILDTSVSIDHDCRIGAHVHVAPGAVLSGGVEVGENVHIGTGAVIIQNIRIRHNATVQAGAVLLRDLEASTTAWACAKTRTK